MDEPFFRDDLEIKRKTATIGCFLFLRLRSTRDVCQLNEIVSTKDFSLLFVAVIRNKGSLFGFDVTSQIYRVIRNENNDTLDRWFVEV